jgi:hypothetical protein
LARRIPQRRGRGRSDGLYDEGFSADRRQGYTCDFAKSLSGAERALDDIGAAIGALNIQHSQNNFMLFQNAGGQGTFLEFNVPGGYGHAVLSAPELWQGPVAEYLSSLTHAAKKE